VDNRRARCEKILRFSRQLVSVGSDGTSQAEWLNGEAGGLNEESAQHVLALQGPLRLAVRHQTFLQCGRDSPGGVEARSALGEVETISRGLG
jgi:hypothetical protein